MDDKDPGRAPACPTNHVGITFQFTAQTAFKPPAGFTRRRPSRMKENGVSGLAQAIRAIS
ncbi:hypothetical protein Asppvi_001960 [Aspergillus pseudoviridinutans]|uniref:Uncharacterized protein n=1 Tax=Aspergillus pseudoviridinutans TaxID=1517512 RepID=A0A9P3BKB0_9EURO|nr:uncharacterized protein Asppvi_001960 [Aspergillus pseudoviridinutans]GIJ92682.1 hypothetical protein Asppvi_001960 [Aspergillus pseudoviridinutans]